ncbi:GntR family transcriptional regulator [Dyella choica]|uniref:GntR family transcriptional regulator n=1 Tax=Dyella choica TaxID=1927959 RepID=A0A3S0RLM7_9GAMM|nr:GntR family transcriptional regulator [Dyella choica]RUL77541.1 GntR family transcriptional regulator [Dyella choica]
MPEPSPPSAQKLLRARGTALHHQLFLALRTRILDGSYGAGDMLPTEDELCSRFGVSRITVRRALYDLEAQGLVERRQGRGTFVLANSVLTRPAATVDLIDSLRRTADVTKVTVLQLEQQEPPAAIAELLGIAPQVAATHAIRVRRFSGTPVMVTDAWLPNSLGLRLTRTVLQKTPLHKLLMQHGVKVGRAVQEVTAIAADAAHADLLQVGLGVPLLKLTRLLYDAKAKPIQHMTVVIVPERSRLLMDAPIADASMSSAGYIVHG